MTTETLRDHDPRSYVERYYDEWCAVAGIEDARDEFAATLAKLTTARSFDARQLLIKLKAVFDYEDHYKNAIDQTCNLVAPRLMVSILSDVEHWAAIEHDKAVASSNSDFLVALWEKFRLLDTIAKEVFHEYSRIEGLYFAAHPCGTLTEEESQKAREETGVTAADEANTVTEEPSGRRVA